MICNTKLMVQSTLFVTENTLFVNQITQNTLLTAFMVTVTDGWQIHNLDNMILGQLKIGERQATFGGVLTITCASPHPPRMPTKTTSLNFSYFQGECPPSPSLLSDSVSPINISICTGTAFGLWSNQLHFILSENMLFDLQIKWCTNQAAALKGQSFRVSVLKWDHCTGQWEGKARHQNSADVSLYLFPANAGEKKATSPFFKRQISNSPPVLFTTGTKKAKPWDKPENIKTWIYLKSTQPKRYR